MIEYIKPQHYVVRPGNKAVPLIALDELPQHIRIDGISKVITDFRDTIHMTCVGELPPRHQNYQVINTNKPPTTNARTPAIESPHSFTPPHIATAELFPGPKKYFGIKEQAPVEQATPSPEFSKHEPLPSWKNTSGLGPHLPAPGKKIYCSHWMSTGECDYAQQGCLYKHEMPLDIGLLNALGYQDIPKWYREKHGIGKLTAIPGSGAHIRGANIAPKPAAPRQQKQRNRRRPTQDLLDAEDLRVRVSRVGLLDSKWAPMTPRNAPGPGVTTTYHSARSGSEADLSSSSGQHETNGSGSSSSRTMQDVPVPVPGAGGRARSVRNGGRRVTEPRRRSMASDYEAVLGREQEHRDQEEAEKYAVAVAKYLDQKERTRLRKIQDEAAVGVKQETIQSN